MLDFRKGEFVAVDLECEGDEIVLFGAAWGDEITPNYMPIYDLAEMEEFFTFATKMGVFITMFYGEYDIRRLFVNEIKAHYEFDAHTVATWLWSHEAEYGLKALEMTKLGMEPRDTIRDLLVKWGTVKNIPKEILEAYNRQDCISTLLLSILEYGPAKKRGMIDLAQLEARMAQITAKMHLHGVKIDKEILPDIRSSLVTDLEKVTQDITVMAGRSVFMTAPKDVSKFLFQDCKIPADDVPILKSGFPSTAAGAIEHLGSNLAVQLVQEWRQIDKLLTTYFPRLYQFDPEDGRIHSDWKSINTVTGRMGGSPWQQFPKKSARGRSLRRAVIPFEGRALVAFDFKQIQLMVLAALADSAQMKEIFEKGLDIHQETAMVMYRVLPDYVTSEMRENAKAVNFHLVFGGGPGVFLQFGYAWEKAKELYANYFARYGLNRWINTQYKEIWKGHVKSFFGRVARMPFVRTTDSAEFIHSAERLAINYPCQMTEADLVKMVMKAVDDYLKVVPCADLLLQIHDELVYEVDLDKLDEFILMVRTIVSGVEFPVRLKVDVEVGNNWMEMGKY